MLPTFRAEEKIHFILLLCSQIHVKVLSALCEIYCIGYNHSIVFNKFHFENCSENL